MSGRDCEGMDTVSVYVTVNGNKEKIDHLCGTEIPAQVMSNGPSMKVEFKSMNLVTENHSKGFRAVYRFTKDFGIRATGVQDVNRGVCAFVFNSTSSRNGSFTSPNFPGLYPRDTECHYFFYGRSSERVEITFTHFDIEGVQPCTSVTASDYVEFSNHRAADRKIPRHCGLLKPKTIESEGNFFRVTFKSNDRFDGTGFQAVYFFKNPAGKLFSNLLTFENQGSIVKGIDFFLFTDTSNVKKMKGNLSASSSSSSASSSLVHNYLLFLTVIWTTITSQLLFLSQEMTLKSSQDFTRWPICL